jgi:m7GpppX diphosphatase
MTSVTANNDSVLQHFIYTKTISKQSSGIRKLLGTINDEQAIITIKMPSFNADDAEVVNLIKNGKINDSLLSNEEYNMYHFTGAESNKMFPFILEVICPANEFHIKKHTDKEFFFVRETEAMYRDMTTVYLENHADEHLEQIQWLLNILNGISEQDSIIYKNADPSNGFVLLPNMNWRSGNTDKPVLDSLNCLAIVNTLGLRSIRDLTATHLTLLKNIKEEGIKAIVGKYGVAQNQLRIYFHYLPSFYHLHVHFTHINQTLGCNIERAIFLDDVIEMLEENTNATAEKTMTIALSSNHDLFNYVTTYLNLPSPLKRMTKGIKHAKDSLKLDRMKELKKKDGKGENADNEDNIRERSSLSANISLSVNDDNDSSIKATPVILDSKFATPESKKVLPKHLRGIGGKIRNATDSLKLNRTKDVKRIQKQTVDNILKAKPTRHSKILNSTDSLKLTRQKDIKRVNAKDIFD